MSDDYDDGPAVCKGGSKGCDGPVTFDADPYDSEINGDDTPVWLCAEHRALYANEI